jgi:mono/diheme cytochrome c family protein
MNRLLGLFALAGGLLVGAGTGYAGDADVGRALARTWCAQCHVVEAAQKLASDVAPPFAQIANDPTKSTSDIAVWLADPHPPMPNLSLTHVEIDHLVAYIESLKTD